MRSLILSVAAFIIGASAAAMPQITTTTEPLPPIPTGTCWAVTVTQTTTPAWPTGPQPGGGGVRLLIELAMVYAY